MPASPVDSLPTTVSTLTTSALLQSPSCFVCEERASLSPYWPALALTFGKRFKHTQHAAYRGLTHGTVRPIYVCHDHKWFSCIAVLFGYDQGLFGGILTSEPFLETLGNPNPTMSGLITAIYDIGCALGAVAAYIWGDRLGRRNSIIYANIIVIVGAAIQTASFEYWQMFVSRIIAGVGVGLSTVAVPILQSETLPARSRGAMLVVQAVVVLIGVSSASWLCFAFLYTEASLQWRLPVAIQIVFSGLVLISTLFIPETPRWLASQHRVEEARNVIARLLDRHEDDEAVTGQLTEILDALATETEGEQAVGWLEVFSNRTKSRNLHRVLIGMGPYMMNQWSGTNALTVCPICPSQLSWLIQPANLSGSTTLRTFSENTWTSLSRFR